MLVGNEDNKMYDNIPLVSYTRKHICLYKTSATELEQEPIKWNPSAYKHNDRCLRSLPSCCPLPG
jgi:hypothetical protein